MTTADPLRPAPFIAGLAGAIAVTLVGIWLVIAPFAVGYQPDGADWVDATVIGVVTGAAVTLIGLLTLIVVAGALRAEVRRRGMAPTSRSTSSDGDPTVGDDPQSSPQPGDLDTIVASLAAALLEDVRDGHHDHAPVTTHPYEAVNFPIAQQRNT